MTNSASGIQRHRKCLKCVKNISWEKWETKYVLINCRASFSLKQNMVSAPVLREMLRSLPQVETDAQCCRPFPVSVRIHDTEGFCHYMSQCLTFIAFLCLILELPIWIERTVREKYKRPGTAALHEINMTFLNCLCRNMWVKHWRWICLFI